MLRRITSLAAAPLLLAFVPGLAAVQADRRFDDEDLERLAASLAAYAEARSAALGLEGARSEVAASLDELRESLAGEDPLRRAADLERAVWLSRGYTRKKLATGSVGVDVFAHGSFAGAGMEYAFRVPEDYEPDGDGYPLILALPDAGEKPAEHLRARWTLRDALDGAVLLCPSMPAAREEWGQVMVNGRPGGLCHVLTGLRIAAERFAVDFDRVYVVGHGKSVPAAVAAGNHGPHRFAGVLGRAGDVGDPGPENFANLPTYFAGAAGKATAFRDAARAAGFDNCELDPTGKDQDLWRWIEEHPRHAHPESVTIVVGKPFPTRVHWLRVAPSSPEARASAVIDRETNSVRIEGYGVTHATLYLNDALLDLERPVRFVCNGVETERVVRRRPASLLDMLQDGTSDAGCVYVAEVVLDMSGEPPAPSPDEGAGEDGEYRVRLAAAGNEVEALWELHLWCRSTGREPADRQVLRRILRIDPGHRDARTALGHREHAGRWLPSEEAYERFRRGQDDETAKARGHVKHKSEWMHPDDRVRAAKGLVKDLETGLWLSAADRRRLAQGWARQDLDWIPPGETILVDDGLWRVDGEWFDLEVANRRRSRIDSMWRIPLPEVLLHSTADREVSLRAADEMARALPDLVRVFGAEPALPLPVAVLRDEEQYDRFAFGDPDGRRPAAHAGRLHVVHSAFFAESWFPRVEGRREFRGMGACYWDAWVPYGDLYGVHSARLAFGLSYVDALDPSPKAVRGALADGPDEGYYAAYQAEKRLPAWLRTGGAVYAERFFHDPRVGTDGDPWWARNWSLENLRGRGGLRDLQEVFDFRLDPDDREDGGKLLIEAGLIVAFLVDGECAPVADEHARFKRLLASGKLHPNHVAALEKAVAAHEGELRAFAGL